MKRRILIPITVLAAFIITSYSAYSITLVSVQEDPLVRMPGTQPNLGAVLHDPLQGENGCINCHGEKPTDSNGNVVAPGFSWSGSMMAQAARDPMLWACMTVAAQDSVWALGNPNAVDICLRCHFPEGWLAGRSGHANPSDLNGSAMIGSDFDGVHCDACHRMWDPFFETTFDGTREGNDWIGYWDEAGNTGPGSGTDSQTGAEQTRAEDATLAGGIKLFSDKPFYQGNLPKFNTYRETAAGQYFVSLDNEFGPDAGLKRASFADTVPDHTVLYSRYHKSKFFCSTCHDVSNPALANLGMSSLPDQSGGTNLITEQYSASGYFHVERTFSEFMLSAYGQQGGAETNLEFQAQGAPTIKRAAKCQDCHMRDIQGKGCEEVAAPIRPDESTEHPKSGAPFHNLQGGNSWITYILATLDDHFPETFDPENYRLLISDNPQALTQALTLDMSQGISPTDNGAALLAASQRAKQQLRLAATIKNLSYDSTTGDLSFRLLNNTGHKLISGFPEGRRMFITIKAYAGGSLIYEANPYDFAVGTLKGLPASSSSPSLSRNERYVDELVYEVHPKSDLTGEEETFHFVLATSRSKDNRIPPKGFDIANAAARLSEPVWHGVSAPDYFTLEEYAGGYDDVSLTLPSGGDRIEVTLYYQGTSREYIEFLRDEINGTADTLSRPTPVKPSGAPDAYIVQTDPFFAGLKAWGDTIWDLWYHNHGLDGKGASVPGIVPFEMTQAVYTGSGGGAPPPPPGGGGGAPTSDDDGFGCFLSSAAYGSRR